MTNPYAALLTWQMSLLESWANGVGEAFTMWQNLSIQQMKLLENNEFKRYMTVIPTGPDWFDHYGRRARDVDPTRV